MNLKVPGTLGLIAVCGTVLAGCGTQSADLFIVKRTGSVPGAALTLRFDDGAQVRCNGGEQTPVTSQDLIDAREIERELAESAEAGLRIGARPGSIQQFAVTFEGGTVRFADNSHPPADIAPYIAKLQALVRRVATGACGLRR